MSVTVDEKKIEEMYLQKIEEKIKEIDAELVYWDRKELIKRTCMSWPFILQEFFYDDRFQKHKIGNKWYFPAAATKKFLTQWISEQKTS